MQLGTERIELPGADPEARKRLSEELHLNRAMTVRMALAFIRTGKQAFGAPRTGKHSNGSVGQKVRAKARRRAKNRAAKASRKANRP